MLAFLGDLLTGILGFLNQFLPDSPFQTLIDDTSALVTGLGWLNWFVPVGTMLGIFAAWLGLMVAFVAVKMVIGKAFSVVGDLI